MNAVAKIEQLPVVQAEGVAMLDVISKAASDPAVNIDKLERLMAMKERMDARAAETAFNDAMSVAQAGMRAIGADRTNSQTKSNYATYSKLDKAIRPIYSENGFALSFDTGEAPADCVRVLCYVSHKAGHSRTYHIDMPADGKGAKGGDVMTKTHAVGSGTSYGMRYLLKMIFNVAVGEEDDDGNSASAVSAAEAVVAEWRAAIDACTTPAELTSRKKELTAAYGGADMVPQSLKSACVAKSGELVK